MKGIRFGRFQFLFCLQCGEAPVVRNEVLSRRFCSGSVFLLFEIQSLAGVYFG